MHDRDLGTFGEISQARLIHAADLHIIWEEIGIGLQKPTKAQKMISM
jgi:hypothetical protein